MIFSASSGLLPLAEEYMTGQAPVHPIAMPLNYSKSGIGHQ